MRKRLAGGRSSLKKLGMRILSSSEPVGKGKTCIGRNADSYGFLDIGGVEVLGGLARVAASDQHIHANIQAPFHERAHQRGAKFLDCNSRTFGVRVGRASRAQWFGAYVFEFTARLKAKRKLLNCP